MRACLLIFFLIINVHLEAQINFWNNYTTTNSGIPSDNVNWVNKSPSGDIYVGTNSGLGKFDGTTWTIFSTSNSNLPSNTIGKSRFDSNGNLWFLCNGLTKFDGTTFTNYNSTNSTLPAFTYNDLDIDQNGVVWLTSLSKGLIKFDLNTAFTFNTTNSGIGTNLVQCLGIENGSIIWIGSSNGGLIKFDGTNWITYKTNNSSNITNSVLKLAIVGNTKWFYKGGTGAALISFDNTNWNFYTMDDGLINPNNIERDDSGKIWLTGSSGTNTAAIGFFNGYSISPYYIQFSPNNLRVKNGILYASSSSSGLYYSNITTYCANGGGAAAALNINNVNSMMDVQGGLWNGNVYGRPGHEFPKGANTYSIFSGSIWVMGESESGRLKGAINLFNQKSDFSPGPLNHYPPAQGEATDCENYDRIWKINKSTIDSFKLGLFSNVPEIINEWPARGNANLGFPINRDMAPFMDVNKDYSYNPLDGDYPLIKGDQALWWVINDGKNLHMTGTEPLGIEMQFMAYAYKTNDVLNNTTFYEVKITNKSDSVIKNTNVTVFVDPDLGNYTDDYIGTNASRNMGIVYNGDAFDEPTNFSTGYGSNVPLVGVNMLQGPKDEFREPVKIKNLFSFNNTQGNWAANPSTPQEYWKYVNTLWADSSHMVYGNNGHLSGGGTQPTNFIFPSDPTDPAGWSECSAFSLPGDRRFLITYGVFNLIPNQTNGFIFSAVNSPTNQAGCVTFKPLLDATDSVKAFFDSTLCKDFNIELVALQNSSCLKNTGNAEVFASSGTPPYFYDWTSGSITNRADSLSAGQYVVTVTDVMGCSKFISFNITDTDGPVVASTINKTKCFGSADGSVSVTVNGLNPPYNYLWSNGDTISTINNLVAGPYEISVKDILGCQTNLTLVVPQPSKIRIASIVTNSTCNLSDGAIDIQVSGGTSPYNYVWSNSETSEDITAVSSGAYSVNVNDSNSCSQSFWVNLNDNGAPNINTVEVLTSSCNNASGGSINVSVNGGTLPYQYSWSNSALTEDITGLSAGIYSLMVTDSNNCKSVYTAELNELPPAGSSICLVSVDSLSNANLIGWQKAVTSDIHHYTIYRESSSAGIYYKIGEVPYSSVSLYTDSLSDPNIKSWRYKITLTDTCGNESDYSFAQKTIHLSLANTPTSILLAWDHYEGFPFNEYRIYRWLSSTGWQVLDSVPSNYTYYYDSGVPVGDSVAYSIEVVAPDDCIFNYRTGRARIATSRSNVKNTSRISGTVTAIYSKSRFDVSLKPNPANDFFTLDFKENLYQNLQLSVKDIKGSEVLKSLRNSLSNQPIKVDIRSLASGVYFVRVNVDDNIKTFKLVKQ